MHDSPGQLLNCRQRRPLRSDQQTEILAVDTHLHVLVVDGVGLDRRLVAEGVDESGHELGDDGRVRLEIHVLVGIAHRSSLLVVGLAAR